MSVIIMGKSINQSYYTLYDNINSFNKFCETFFINSHHKDNYLYRSVCCSRNRDNLNATPIATATVI